MRKKADDDGCSRQRYILDLIVGAIRIIGVLIMLVFKYFLFNRIY